MRKILTSLFILTICFANTFAQQIIFDDFESYAAGSKLAAQSPSDVWVTWSGAAVPAEDGTVSSDIAYAGLNSVKIVTNNDLVLLFNDLTTGRYRFEFYMNIVSGKEGYFNVLQDFLPSGSVYGMDVFFNPDGTGTVDAGGASSGSFNYLPDTWLHIKIFFDLDLDFATLVIDNEEIVSWIWSSGSSGGNTLQKLDAVDFYGWTDVSTGQYYFDNVEFNQITVPDSPQNLTVNQIGNNAVLSWEAPTAETVDYYSILRNGKVIATGLTELTYNDLDLYPNVYDYSVIAFYSNFGYSESSNIETVTIDGGVERKNSLFEIVTGTWCTYCPGAAMGAEDLLAAGANAAILEYHGGDSYEIPATTQRIDYYGISSYPTAVVDGKYIYAGGNHTVSLYPGYNQLYQQAIEIPALYELNLEVRETTPTNYEAVITVVEPQKFIEGNFKLHVALTESNIQEAWQGQTELNSLVFEMLPDANGNDVSFLDSQTNSFQYVFSINSTDHNIADCEIVAFLQNNDTKEILQSDKLSFATITTSLIGGSATADPYQICETGNSVLTVSNYYGENIQWQIYDDIAGWEDIVGATANDYTVNGLTVSTLFRAKITGYTLTETYSSTAHVAVSQNPTAGTATSSLNEICSEEEVIYSLTGYSGNIQWQESTDGTNWNNVTTGTGIHFEEYTVNLTTEKSIRASVYNFGCNSVVSNVIDVTVNPLAISNYTYTVTDFNVDFLNTSENAEGYSWDFGDTGISTDENPSHTYAANDTYTVTLTAINSLCGDDVYSHDILINYVSIKELNDLGIIVYPNPSNGLFTIESTTENASVKIFDITGKIILESEINNNLLNVDISKQSKGIYILSFNIDNKIINSKIVLK